jgi:two-component system chemotaxis response regulator CheY
MMRPRRRVDRRVAGGVGSAEGLMSGRRLLVVDDAMLMRRLIRDVAVEAGWEVAGEARNGAEAVELYQELRPDLVTMDVVMPQMSGLEALRRIREHDPDARIVMVTALDQKQTLLDSIRDGAIDFIVKPFERSRIVSLLNKERPRPRPSTPAPPDEVDRVEG